MKKYFLFIFFGFLYLCMAAQDDLEKNDKVEQKRKNALYFEFIGNAISFGSINYERLIYNKDHINLYLRGGFFYLPYSFVSKQNFAFPFVLMEFSGLPIEFSFTIGKKWRFDSGIGLTYWTDQSYDDIFYDSKILVTFRSLGLKYCKKDSGLWLRFNGIGIAYEIVRFKNEFLMGNFTNRGMIPLLGIGAGYCF